MDISNPEEVDNFGNLKLNTCFGRPISFFGPFVIMEEKLKNAHLEIMRQNVK